MSLCKWLTKHTSPSLRLLLDWSSLYRPLIVPWWSSRVNRLCVLGHQLHKWFDDIFSLKMKQNSCPFIETRECYVSCLILLRLPNRIERSSATSVRFQRKIDILPKKCQWCLTSLMLYLHLIYLLMSARFAVSPYPSLPFREWVFLEIEIGCLSPGADKTIYILNCYFKEGPVLGFPFTLSNQISFSTFPI